MRVHVQVAARVLTLRERKAFHSFMSDGASHKALADAVGVLPETIGGALNNALLNARVLAKVEAFMVREGFKRVSARRGRKS